MSSSDVDEARRLLERAEREVDPKRKFVALEEGINILDEYASDTSVFDQQRNYALNLRRSSIRRLLNQLDEMRSIQFYDWLHFIALLIRFETDLKAVLEEDASLKDKFSRFFSLWNDELMELSQRSK
jgi:hypothetical protein